MGEMRRLRNGNFQLDNEDPDGCAWVILVGVSVVVASALHIMFAPHLAITIAAFLGVLIGAYIFLGKLPAMVRFWVMAVLIGVPAGFAGWGLSDGDWIWAIFAAVVVGGVAGSNFLSMGEENYAPPLTQEGFEEAQRIHARELAEEAARKSEKR